MPETVKAKPTHAVSLSDLTALEGDSGRLYKDLLGGFAVPIDEHARTIYRETVAQREDETYLPLRFDVYYFEENLAALSGLLDTCLRRRQEYHQLEALLLAAAQRHYAFAAGRADAQAMEMGPDVAAAFERQRAAMEAASAVLAAGATTAHEKSTKLLLDDALADARRLAEWNEKMREPAIRARWELADALDAQVVKQHRTLGSPSNFAQRASIIRDYFKVDFLEAVERARCVEPMLKPFFGFECELPDVNELSARSFLDMLVGWTRDVIEKVRAASEQESIIHEVYPLTLANGQQVADDLMRNASHELILAPWKLPAAYHSARLVAVGLSVSFAGVTLANLPLAKMTAINGMIFPPTQDTHGAPAALANRAPVPVTGATMLDGTTRPLLYEAVSIQNIDPMPAGAGWSYKLTSATGIPPGLPLSTVNLHLVMRVRLSRARNDYDNLVR